MKYCLIIFFFCFGLQLIWAQDPVSWHLTTKDGLPSNEIYEIVQDKQGYIWIGTDGGLCKYDGQSLSYYSNKKQKGKAVSHFQEDSQGRLWLQSFEGELLFIENDSLHYFEPLEELGEVRFYSYWIDYNGDVWVSNNYNEIYIYSKKEKSWQTISLGSARRNASIREIIGTKDGTVYVLTDLFLIEIKGGICTKMELEDLFQFAPEFLVEQPNGVSPVIGMKMLYVNERLILISHHAKFGVFEYKDGVVRFLGKKYINNQDWYTAASVNNLSKTAEGEYWVLTRTKGGVPFLNLNGGITSIDSKMHLFPNKNLSSIFIDREGSYWVGTLNEGIYVIPNWDMQIYNSINSFFEGQSVDLLCKINDKHMVVSSDEGKLYHYNANSKQINTYQAPKGRGLVLNNGEEQLLYGSTGGLLLFDYNNLESWDKIIIQNLPQHITNAFAYKNDYLILSRGSSGHGISPLTEGNGPPHPARLLDTTFFPLWTRKGTDGRMKLEDLEWIENYECQDRILLAQKDQVTVVAETGETIELLGEQQQSLQAMSVTVANDKTIWINTFAQGIYGFDSTFQLQYHLTTKDGLISNRIRQIVVDNQNNLWLSSSKGVQYWNLQTQEYRIYTIEDGLPSYPIKDIMCFDHKIWLSTDEGLVVFKESLNALNDVPPTILIKKIAINDKDTMLRTHYDLEYDQNFLAINVEGVAHKSRGNFQYKYRMLGIDTIWRLQANPINIMRFPQQNPGSYTFEVKTVNEDGVESAEPARITFFIAAPYWETWWFRLLIASVFVFVVIAVAWNQIRTQRLQNRVSSLYLQALQSQMNPHFVFNVLTAVQNLWLQQKNEAALRMQSSFAKLLRKIFQYSSKESIEIEQVKDFIDNYLDLEQIRFDHQVIIDFKIDDELYEDDYKIPPLLIQPIIENSFKHGLFHKPEDKRLWIFLKKEEAYLYNRRQWCWT